MASRFFVTPGANSLGASLIAPMPVKFPGVRDQRVASVIMQLMDDPDATRSINAMTNSVSSEIRTSAASIQASLDELERSGYLQKVSQGNGHGTRLVRCEPE